MTQDNGNNRHIAAEFIRRNMIRGLLIALPFLVVFGVVGLLYGLLDGWIGPALGWIIRQIVPPSWLGPFTDGHIPGVSLIFTVLFLVGLGWVGSWHIGKRGLTGIDHVFLAIPGVRVIYSAARKVVDAFNGDATTPSFQRVVLVPCGMLKTVGFVTAHSTDKTTGRKVLTCFIPTPPNPFSGYVTFIFEDDIIDPGWTIDEGLKIAATLGVLTPKQIALVPAKPDRGSAPHTVPLAASSGFGG